MNLTFNLFLFILLELVQSQVQHFDYIVVGAGPAGSMTAIGLADRGYSTLLIDAGQDHMNPNISTPGLHVRASEDPQIAWDFYVKHFEESTGLRQRVLYPRVAGLGGCTLHNAMIHILPNRQDFDKMVKLTGDQTWSESNMRKYYNEMVRPTFIERTPLIRGMNKLGTGFQRMASGITNIFTDKDQGWLKISTVNLINLISIDSKLIDIARNLLPTALISDFVGFDLNAESNPSNLDQERSFLVPINADPENGLKRRGVYEYLKQKTNQPNSKLTIWTNTLATRILVNEQRVAYGIQYLSGSFLYKAGKLINTQAGQPGEVHANREVIVSAGTFNTPQLMMLSGIGDFKHLREVGINPIINLPGVGRNLHDRYEVSVNAQFPDDFELSKPCLFRADSSDPCYNRFAQSGTGPYTFNGVLSGTTIKSSSNLVSPDIFLLASAGYFTGYHVGMGDEVVANKNSLSFQILKAHTFNHAGRVKLRSVDPTDVPDINFKYFSEGMHQDLMPIIKGIRAARNFLNSFSTPYKELFPGDHLNTDKQLEDYIMNTAWGHHATGTMKIGTSNDPLAVLDGQFRVRNVQNLRVVDMSIFPEIPGYFPVLYLYMIGAKAADVITQA